MSDSVMEIVADYAVTPDDHGSPIVNKMREGMTRFLVGKRMFCALTGNVLDYRTCLVLVDRDQDPVDVYAPEVLRHLEMFGTDLLRQVLDTTGYRFDLRSVERAQRAL